MDVLGWWRRQRLLDAPLAFGCTVLLRLLARYTILEAGDPTALASGVIVASAALGALAITPIAIVLALTPGPRLRSLMKFQTKPIRRSMSWAVVTNLFAVAVGIIDLIVDSKDHAEQTVRWAMTTLEFAALLAMVRLVWFFVSLLSLDEVDRSDEIGPTPSNN